MSPYTTYTCGSHNVSLVLDGLEDYLTSYNGFQISRSCFGKYCKASIFSDAQKLCCNQPKIQTKMPNLRVFHQKDANGKANSKDPDQTAPPGAV